MYNGDCYPNGSLFRDVAITVPPNYYLHCVLPNSTLNGGEWTKSNGEQVDCDSSYGGNNLQCIKTTSPANISLYRPNGEGFHSSEDQLYKCCLPTSCSNASTNIMIAHIFSKLSHIVLVYMIPSLLVTVGRVQIVDFHLTSDITTFPQQLTLHCITIGDGVYTVSFNYNDQPPNIANIQCPSGSDCNNHRQLLHSSNTTYDNNITLTWDTETITYETSFNQSSNGDQMYKCHLQSYKVNRESTLIVKGKKTKYYIIIMID